MWLTGRKFLEHHEPDVQGGSRVASQGSGGRVLYAETWMTGRCSPRRERGGRTLSTTEEEGHHTDKEAQRGRGMAKAEREAERAGGQKEEVGSGLPCGSYQSFYKFP